jgi:thiol-disulfide isomerase/thioredoxin
MAHKLMRLVVLFLIPLGNYAQTNKPFILGDSMPPLVFTSIFNQPGRSISLNDYRGQLIIIDFWNRWCGTCIEAFPKMEKLQKEFGDKIKILLVTSDNNEALIKLFKKVKLPLLPIISGDTILNNMFPHITVPHHIWVNPDGRIQFIAHGYNATAQNVSKVLERKPIKLELKAELSDVDDAADLLREGNGRFQKYITNYSFSMSKINEDWHTGFGFNKDTINNTCGFKFVNSSLLDLYKVAFSGAIDYMLKEFAFNNRVQFIGEDVQKFFNFPVETDSIPAWERRNTISYESKWKIKNDSLAYQYLQEDANRLFPFLVKVETKEVTCYILKKASNFNGTKSTGKEKVFEYTDSFYTQKNMPVLYFVESLRSSELLKNYPVVDETNYNANVDLQLTNAFTDIINLKAQLLQNGFLLEEGKRKIPMLLICNK